MMTVHNWVWRADSQNNIEAWNKSTCKKEKNQFVRFYRALLITAERVGKLNIQVKYFNRLGAYSYDVCNF